MPTQGRAKLFHHSAYEGGIELPRLNRTQADTAHTGDALALIGCTRIVTVNCIGRAVLGAQTAGNALIVTRRLDGSAGEFLVGTVAACKL